MNSFEECIAWVWWGMLWFLWPIGDALHQTEAGHGNQSSGACCVYRCIDSAASKLRFTVMVERRHTPGWWHRTCVA